MVDDQRWRDAAAARPGYATYPQAAAAGMPAGMESAPASDDLVALAEAVGVDQPAPAGPAEEPMPEWERELMLRPSEQAAQPEVWSNKPAPGRVVCAVPVEGGICGHPFEGGRVPWCREHTPDPAHVEAIAAVLERDLGPTEERREPLGHADARPLRALAGGYRRLVAAVDAEHDRRLEHSAQLNTVAWRLAQALREVPAGAAEVRGDPVQLAGRVAAELERARVEREDALRRLHGVTEDRLRAYEATGLDLAEIEQRAAAADPGPWQVSRPAGGYPQRVQTRGSVRLVAETYTDPSHHPDNTIFIANAREDVPLLLAEVRALRRRLAIAGVSRWLVPVAVLVAVLSLGVVVLTVLGVIG